MHFQQRKEVIVIEDSLEQIDQLGRMAEVGVIAMHSLEQPKPN